MIHLFSFIYSHASDVHLSQTGPACCRLTRLYHSYSQFLLNLFIAGYIYTVPCDLFGIDAIYVHAFKLYDNNYPCIYFSAETVKLSKE